MHMSGGGNQQQAQPSQQTITNNPIADWAQPTATALIGSQMRNAYNVDENGNVTGQRGFTPFGGQTNAQGQFTGSPVSQDQYNQQLQVAGLGVAGPSALQQKSYEGAANLQTPGQFGPATQMAGYGTASALGAGQNFQNMATNPGSVQAYMNPYLQASLDPQLAEIQRQYGITGAQQAGQATQSGAFGGGRDAIMAAENERNKNTAMNQVIGQGYNTAFNNAQSQMNTGAQLGLQGAQAGIQGAGQLGQLGTQQLAAQQGILGTQNQMGSQEQQNQQQVINQALQNYGNQQNYGTTQATNIMNLLRSTPTTQTQTMYQAPPSATSQIAGLGTAGVAGYKLATMAGGGIAKVKKFDVGGSVENKLYELPNDKLTEEIKITPSQTIKNTGNSILKERQLGTTPMPAFAPGGIVAFAEGGESDIIPVEVPEEEDMIGNPMGEFTMPSRIMAASRPSAPTAPATAPKGPINVFDKAMAFVLPHEGGFVHHKNDRGGATNRGITQNTLSNYLKRKATIDDVKNLDEETAKDIYLTQFFNPIASKLDDPKAQMVAFNAAIASGPKYANRLIDKHNGDPYEMLKEHTNFMVNDIPKKDPTQKVFVKGWENRQNDLGNYIQKFAEGGDVKHFAGGNVVTDAYRDAYDRIFNKTPESASEPNKIPSLEKTKAPVRGIASHLPQLPEGVRVRPEIPSIDKIATRAVAPVEAPQIPNKVPNKVPSIWERGLAASDVAPVKSAVGRGITGVGRVFSPLLSAPASIIGMGGEEMSRQAANTLASPMMEANRRALQDNSFLGALGADSSMAAAILDAAQKGERVQSTPTMATPNKVASPMADLTDYYKQESVAKPLSAAGNQPPVTLPKPSTLSEENVLPSITPMGPSADLMQEPTQAPQDGDSSTRSTLQQMLMDRMAQQGKSAEQDKWMSLLSAGLGMMGGTSPYAAANIGQGAQAGIASQLAAKKNQMSEQNSILSGMLGLEKSQAMDKYHQAQMAQNAEISRARLDEIIRSHTASEEEKRMALAELTRRNNLQDQNTDEARQLRSVSEARTTLEKMEANHKRNLENKYIKQNPMWQSSPELQSKYNNELQALYNNPKYKMLEQAAYPGMDFSTPATAPVNTNLDLNKYYKK